MSILGRLAGEHAEVSLQRHGKLNRGAGALPATSSHRISREFVNRTGRCQGYQDLRAEIVTDNKRTLAVIPRSGQEIHEKPCLVLFTPLQTRHREGRAGEELGRLGDGIARAIEDLRGVRLSLVPRPNHRQRVLPGM